MHQELGYCLPSGVRTHIVNTCNNLVQLFLLLCVWWGQWWGKEERNKKKKSAFYYSRAQGIADECGWGGGRNGKMFLLGQHLPLFLLLPPTPYASIVDNPNWPRPNHSSIIPTIRDGKRNWWLVGGRLIDSVFWLSTLSCLPKRWEMSLNCLG